MEKIRKLNTNYNEIYQRMERVGMIENYILPNYEPLHSESREVLAERLIECLKNWENCPNTNPTIKCVF